MRIIITLLIVAAALAPVMYLLFFTSIVDRCLLRLRAGDRSKKLEAAVDSVHEAARKHVETLHKQQEEMAKAAASLAGELGTKVPPRSNRAVYAIQNIRIPEMFWSVAGKWEGVERHEHFDWKDKRDLQLPNGGKWKKMN